MLSISDHRGVEVAVEEERAVHKMAAKIRGERGPRGKSGERRDRGVFPSPLFHMGHSVWHGPPHMPVLPSRSTLMDTPGPGALS